MTKLGMDQFDAHFRLEIGKRLYAFVRNNVLDHHRFLFYNRMGKTSIYKGFCSHCKADYVLRESFLPKHGKAWKCEKCRSTVRLHSSGRGRGKLKASAYVIWYDKSAIDPDVIVATGYKVNLNFEHSINADIEFIPVTRYLFRYGQGAQMAIRDHYTAGFFYNRATHFLGGWQMKKQVSSIVGKHYFTRYNSVQSSPSMRKAVKGTPFEKSCWQTFRSDSLDSIYIFSTIAKYPFIEFLAKTGLGEIARKMIHGDSIYRCINLRGKTFESIVGLSKQEFGAWKQACKDLKPETLRAYKWCRDKAERISWEQAERFGPAISQNYNFTKVSSILETVLPKRFVRYIENQYQKDRRHFGKVEDVVTSYKDYLDEAKSLEMDMQSEAVLYPNLLRVAHHKTTSQVQIKKDEVVNKKIMALQPKLESYWYEDQRFFVRPIKDAGELFAEGKYLQHCVGRYGSTYANGGIVLLVVRRLSDPETPFYTAEIVNDRLVQCRGLRNNAMTTDVKTFMDEYMVVLQPRLIRRSKPKQKQEAVV